MKKSQKNPTISFGQQLLLWEIYHSENGYVTFEIQTVYKNRVSFNENIRILLFSEFIKRKNILIDESFINAFYLSNDSFLVLEEWLSKLKKSF